MPTKVETVDVTPPWTAVAQIHLMVLDNPKASDEARTIAHEDIMNMAMMADAYVELQKEKSE